MSQIQILHNPRCSKSRQTLALLEDQGIQPEVIQYLKTPLDQQQLVNLQQKLGFDSVRQMMRVKESLYKSLNLAQATEQQLIEAMAENPVLLERPVVINANKARIGRPPEQVLEIL
ncbi:arsenate reductase (glutaredoxin) [Lacimicrobium alkaliphilum]|uniref:Arsenate reductase n=1 Tax=Lacimicrobium alkaliphilum TaxID=1526571 RepID=A0A0U2ZHJ6_9ALTE|nr:arsenate reductase (glutaredoxin) [Lacimicrobium alkaliphilum]ALS98439.1 arsenate reductase [Lacimicrobium alkaliphilum]